jgi:Flp pilus assembly protein TadB
MADFVTLSCPNCGGKLQVTPDLERFACAYCGHEHVVRRGGGIVSLSPVVEGLQQVRAGVDKTSSELAIRRLREEISALERRRLARPTQPSTEGDWGLALAVLVLVSGGIAVLGISLVLGVGVLVAALAVVLYLDTKRKQRTARAQEMEARNAEIDVQIAAKTVELDRHRRLVHGA